MGASFTSLVKKIEQGQVRRVTASSSARALLISRLVAIAPTPTLILTATAAEAAQVTADLALFSRLLDIPPPLPFPAWETLPHEFASPLPEIAGQRMAALMLAASDPAPILVAEVAAVLHRLPPKKTLEGFCLHLKKGVVLDPGGLSERLAAIGYRAASEVQQPGQFAIRGDILDVYPAHLSDPVRIEWFGDEVDTVRGFDPVTQRSTVALAAVLIAPVTELPDDPDMIYWAKEQVTEIARTRNLDEAAITLETGRLTRTPRTHGIETWAPFFFADPMDTVTDYLPDDIRMVLIDEETVQAAARGMLRKATEAMADEAGRGTIVPAVDALFVTLEQLIGKRPTLALDSRTAAGEDKETPWRTAAELGFGRIESGGEHTGEGFADRFTRLRDLALSAEVTITCPDTARAEAFVGILAEHDIRAKMETPVPEGGIHVVTGDLSAGLMADGQAYLTEAEIFGRGPAPPSPPRSRIAPFLSGFTDLKPGDYVVHIHHGIGIYEGLSRIDAGGVEADFLTVEYLGGDRIYVPMERLDLVQKYSGGDDTHPRVDRMGGKTWDKTRKKARKALTELAHDLVELAAAREVAKGYAFAPEGAVGVEFAASFPYTETPDQQRVIEEIRADMEKGRPMDRLVCGDVGYGKTEVALRGAFKAMLDGRQVAFLVPTTLLAQQHFATCVKRFAPYPFKVALLSRFVDAKAQKQVFEGLADGTIDLVIATHRLLSKKEIPIKRLGLLIVDEEQRFGVTHKERIKKWKTSVDVLTLTATPIPRTLQLSLIGVRDLSIIDTPPPDRRAIVTRVARYDPTLMAEAIERELARNGQVFFIHNRVKTLGGMARILTSLVPKIRLATAHGQMPERQLEKVMAEFISGEKNVLLSTSIVESGLDIPRANTIIIDRADRFGLSELYQLRGRVGRSGVQAYAYLMGPEEGWHGEARERLMAIQAFTELGSGFRIAARDLEIRGAGSLLGHRQSGQIAAVGIDTYMKLIKEAMAEIRGETVAPDFSTDIRIGNGAISDRYIADGSVRLSIYKRISGLEREEDADTLMEELADRFGPVPDITGILIDSARLGIAARALRIVRIEHLEKTRYGVTFDADNTLSEAGLRMLLAEYGPKIRFQNDLAFTIDLGRTPEDGGRTRLAELLHNL